VYGVSYNADGTGGLVKNPADQLQHFFANFVYNDWQSGAWFPLQAAPFDAAALSALQTFFNTRGLTAAIQVLSQTTALDLLDAFCLSWEIRNYWTRLGCVGFLAEDRPLPSTLYIDSPWWRGELSQIGPVSFSYDSDEALIDRVTADHIYCAAQSRFCAQMEVRDVSIDRQAVDSIQLRYLKAAI